MSRRNRSNLDNFDPEKARARLEKLISRPFDSLQKSSRHDRQTRRDDGDHQWHFSRQERQGRMVRREHREYQEEEDAKPRRRRHGHDGDAHVPAVNHAASIDYTKTLKLSLYNGASRIFTIDDIYDILLVKFGNGLSFSENPHVLMSSISELTRVSFVMPVGIEIEQMNTINFLKTGSGSASEFIRRIAISIKYPFGNFSHALVGKMIIVLLLSMTEDAFSFTNFSSNTISKIGILTGLLSYMKSNGGESNSLAIINRNFIARSLQ